MICPKTGFGCCDDLCHGSGCLDMNGYPMLAECDVCGGLIDEEIPDCSTCTCDGVDDDFGYEADPEFCESCGVEWFACACSLNYPKEPPK